jgi:tRNA pseudouridine55 synthase
VTAAPGLVLVDKPVGPSSFAVVSNLRGRHGLKAGHAGTLDPLASGLLLVLLGPATRLARYLVGLDKRYATQIELGRRTTTGDAEGDVLVEGPVPGDLAAAVHAFLGEVELPIPAASAVRIGGERAYRLHRRGIQVDMPARKSIVHEIRVLRREGRLVDLELHVGSGTYVRAIADALGGHCRSLRRLAVGSFRVDDADEARIVAPLAALPHLPELALADDEVVAVGNGRAIRRSGEGLARLSHDGRLVAVARLNDGYARPETVLG